jgi:polyhydroxybutyrate depolymerase
MLHVPPHIQVGRRYPFVIMLHPAEEDGSQFAFETSMSDISDEHGVLVVYPDGIDSAWQTDAPDDRVGQGSEYDVHFISRLIDAVNARVCVDPKRVYASGRSSGGSMVYLLGCALADRIAAIAPVAGTYTYTYTPC